MRFLAKAPLLVMYTATLGLFNYELTAKLDEICGKSLPGWQVARQVELTTPWYPWTGIAPLDHLLHEGQEALSYYHSLPG